MEKCADMTITHGFCYRCQICFEFVTKMTVNHNSVQRTSCLWVHVDPNTQSKPSIHGSDPKKTNCSCDQTPAGVRGCLRLDSQAHGLAAEVCFPQNLCCNKMPSPPLLPIWCTPLLLIHHWMTVCVRSWISPPQIARPDKPHFFFEPLRSPAIYSKSCVMCAGLWTHSVCRRALRPPLLPLATPHAKIF